MNQRWKLTCGVMVVLAAAAGAAEKTSEPARARAIVESTGVQGGLVVVSGCEDAGLLCALADQGPFVVQGLSTDANSVASMGERIVAAGAGSKVSAIEFDGQRLPYIDGMVNLVVIEGGSKIPRPEILRVLAPQGSAVFLSADGKLTGEKIVKPRPSEIDEWSHFLHDASGNAVAMDRKIGPPDSLQWLAGPR